MARAVGAALLAAAAGPALAQDPLTTRCESAPIAALFKAFETPGHTMGTASFAFDAFDALDGGRRHRAFTVGGLGLNAIKGSEQVEAYIASIQRIRKLTEDGRDPVTTHLTTHAFSNGLAEAKDLIKGRKPGDAHPLVDPKGFREQLDALQAGAGQRLVAERAKKAD